jgi:hypothetical protein
MVRDDPATLTQRVMAYTSQAEGSACSVPDHCEGPGCKVHNKRILTHPFEGLPGVFHLNVACEDRFGVCERHGFMNGIHPTRDEGGI